MYSQIKQHNSVLTHFLALLIPGRRLKRSEFQQGIIGKLFLQHIYLKDYGVQEIAPHNSMLIM